MRTTLPRTINRAGSVTDVPFWIASFPQLLSYPTKVCKWSLSTCRDVDGWFYTVVVVDGRLLTAPTWSGVMGDETDIRRLLCPWEVSRCHVVVSRSAQDFTRGEKILQPFLHLNTFSYINPSVLL
jgi:hypothetical protein